MFKDYPTFYPTFGGLCSPSLVVVTVAPSCLWFSCASAASFDRQGGTRGVGVLTTPDGPAHAMVAQLDPDRLKRLNWRESLRDWLRRPRPQPVSGHTGSENVSKPVLCQTGSEIEPEPVRQQTGSGSKPVCPETGSGTVHPELTAEEIGLHIQAIWPLHHARTLLAWLQARGHGGQYWASVSMRDKAYPQVCQEYDWDPLPWHGPGGVGKHLGDLCGGRPIRPDPDAGGKPTRCYKIPAAVVELAAVEKRRA